MALRDTDFGRRAADPETIAAEARAAGIVLTSLDAGGVSLALWSANARRDARPILLLHGVTYSSLSVFDLPVPGRPRHAHSLLLSLADAGFAAYALDAEGYGLSDARYGGATLSECCAHVGLAVAAIAVRHGGARVVLVGWSWGAQVAARFLSYEAPDAPVSHLVFWGSCWGGGFSGPPHALRGLSPPATPRRVNTPAHAIADFITPAHYAPAVRDAFGRQALRLDPTSPTLGLHAVAYDLPLHDPRRIRVPTIAIHGSRDPMASPADLQDFLGKIKCSSNRYVVIPSADHNAQFSYSSGILLREMTRFVTV